MLAPVDGMDGSATDNGFLCRRHGTFRFGYRYLIRTRRSEKVREEKTELA